MALAALLLLGACGKVGPVRPPGPRDQITYPRLYPAPDATTPDAAAPPPLSGPTVVPPTIVR